MGIIFLRQSSQKWDDKEVHLAMAYFRWGDPLEDFQRLDRRQAQVHARLPVCDGCCRAITGEAYYAVFGEVLCCRCMEDRFRRRTEDFLLEEVG